MVIAWYLHSNLLSDGPLGVGMLVQVGREHHLHCRRHEPLWLLVHRAQDSLEGLGLIVVGQDLRDFLAALEG